MSLLASRRACWLFLGGLLLAPSVGCTEFQTIGTSKWLDTNWVTGKTEQPVNHVLTI